MVLNLKTIPERDIKVNNKEKIVKKLLFEIIDKLTKDADMYNSNGSLWLINTDSTRWIFEFTKSKTLWYNYNFFRSALKFISLDINEDNNQKYITEWFESRYLNINQVKHTIDRDAQYSAIVKDTIQNGVKETHRKMPIFGWQVEDAIQNGVKHTESLPENNPARIKDTIENGVKEDHGQKIMCSSQVEDTIQNGLKKW